MPHQFGKYLLQRKLAEGGMAEVFLARQSGMEGFEKPVVIKRILPHLSHEQQFVDMFLNEARLAARLSHPALVQIFDFGRIDDQFFIAMEFVHGEDLRGIAKVADRKQRRPSPALIARVFADLLGGLHYAHTRAGPDGRKLGLVHRDISPQNVLVTYEGGVKLLDFGIAKATESQQGQQTQAGLLKGKYAYMSPEQCRGRPIDCRSDVFAAGTLLWELLTWKRLFRRESDLSTLVAVADEPIPRPTSLRPDIPVELDLIVMRALSRSLDERYPTAQAMQGDLEAVIRKYGWEADSIRLQQYMREVFADKLALQDEAIRAAGLGSIEDLLVRVEEGMRLAWIEGDPRGRTPQGLELPSLTPPPIEAPPSLTPAPRRPAGWTPAPMPPSRSRPVPLSPPAGTPSMAALPPGVPASLGPSAITPSGPVAIAPVPSWPPPPGSVARREPTGPSSLLARELPDRGASVEVASPPSRWRRALLIGGSTVVLAAAGLGAAFWPGANRATVQRPQAGEAKIRVLLDQPGAVTVDGVTRPPARETEVTVSANTVHELRIRGAGAERQQMVPPLTPGMVHTVRLRLAP